MQIKKLSMMLLSALSCAALLNGCGSSSKEGTTDFGGAALVSESTCIVCHSTTTDSVSGASLVQEYANSVHNPANFAGAQGCQGCHGGGAQHNGVGPIPFPNPLASDRCTVCHTDADLAPLFVMAKADFVGNNCSHCHTASGSGSVHAIQVTTTLPTDKRDNCVGCHDVAAPQHGAERINDNNGVRAIIPEFNKRSHHITGATPTNAQCAVCHLEGKVVSGKVVVDATRHMADAKVHLRDADNNLDHAWDGTNHSEMDNFCFSCHDSNGAAAIPNTFSGVAGFTGTAMNPFGDTLTNGYDQVARAGVVDVKTAFTTTNASHHAVSGQRYTYRFSTAANAAAWAARTGNPVPDASQIAEGHTVSGVTSPFGTGLTYDPAGPEEGGEATLYEGGKFVATYIPLGATQNVGDNSILHCGDCHTVGQWKVGSSTNADGTTTSVAIGAHGSVNEYLLRNSLGTDEIHNNLTYVCFNCHKAGEEAATQTLWNELVAEGKITDSVAVTGTYLNCADFGGYTNASKTACVSGAGVTVTVNKPATRVPTWKAGWNALHPTVVMGQLTGYYVAHAVSAMHGQCQADSANAIGATRLVASWEPDKVGVYDYLPAAGATAASPSSGSTEPFVAGSNANSGNITGIACINCHNSGLRSAFGGIHGGNYTYTDGLGRLQTTYRFMPGMGNYRYAPPGGWDGKDVSDPTLLTVNNPIADNGPAFGSGSAGFPGASGKPIGGCYTNSDTDTNPGYSTCSHHGTSSAAQSNYNPAGTVTQSGATAYFRTTYGGGTTGNPTTYEPTVREATSGSTLVTRPLKY
ncbi:hypothetical protein [Geobacter sp. AOG2]|uniref:hypothetical protein n=1 Tax=Geobacter sp. AOG2 TaxID=1566347 RepID=UPI001CC58443|nr:hypothetical protein [Geobacter sp. AOG2]GFE61982.1 C-type polyheme cytochrome OmcC [Geobacter sp. AOG2]